MKCKLHKQGNHRARRRREDGRCSQGIVDGGDERGRGGGAQGPGRTLPLKLHAEVSQVHPPGRQGQGQRPQRRLAGQEAASRLGAGVGRAAASAEG
jgi:hypothetical protein